MFFNVLITGCIGKSYESRRCVGSLKSCPNEQNNTELLVRSTTDQTTTPEYYTLATRRFGARHDGYFFQPNPLGVAFLHNRGIVFNKQY